MSLRGTARGGDEATACYTERTYKVLDLPIRFVGFEIATLLAMTSLIFSFNANPYVSHFRCYLSKNPDLRPNAIALRGFGIGIHSHV